MPVSKAATLGSRNAGLVTTLALSGASFDNIQTTHPALHGEHQMASLGYLEVLDARGHIAQRVRIDHLPTHIGRAYTNHIVVDDPYVCPLHASIFADEQGRLICRDRDSVNGLRNGTAGRPGR